MICLSGSYAQGTAINDRRVDPKTGMISEYYSDVDVLVITNEKKLVVSAIFGTNYAPYRSSPSLKHGNGTWFLKFLSIFRCFEAYFGAVLEHFCNLTANL